MKHIKHAHSFLVVVLTFILLTFGLAAQANEITFYHYDGQGNPIAATDIEGNVVWEERYSPTGEPLLNQPAKDDHPIGYKGHVYDKDLGLVYMGSRYYDPKVGRFISVDPVGFTPDNIQMFNRYAYANNNPYKYFDPDGRNPLIFAAGYAAFEIGSTLYDWWSAADTLTDPSASGLDKGAAAGGVLLGIWAPGPGSAYTGLGKQGLKNVVDTSSNAKPLLGMNPKYTHRS